MLIPLAGRGGPYPCISDILEPSTEERYEIGASLRSQADKCPACAFKDRGRGRSGECPGQALEVVRTGEWNSLGRRRQWIGLRWACGEEATGQDGGAASMDWGTASMDWGTELWVSQQARRSKQSWVPSPWHCFPFPSLEIVVWIPYLYPRSSPSPVSFSPSLFFSALATFPKQPLL